MGDFRIKTCPVGQIGTNCYVLYRKNDEEQKKAVIIDPGANGAFLLNKFHELGVVPEAILLTHGHFDHILAITDIKRAFPDTKLYVSELEKELLEDPQINLSVNFGHPYSAKGDVFIKDGDKLSIADMDFSVIATPGHTAGSVCFWIEDEQVLMSGDTLFLESLGRTDLATGSQAEIIKSIKERLFVLPEDTMVYPGHGEPTTIEHEKQNNPVAHYRG